MPFTSRLLASCGLLITTLPEPLGVRAMFPFVADTIALPFTSKSPPNCGVVSTTSEVIAPATIGTSLTWTLPATDAAVSGYALVSDASGTLSWAAAGGGANGNGTNEIFWENDQTITGDYTITNNKNAGSFGPIEIGSGVTVTVGSGETWTVV